MVPFRRVGSDIRVAFNPLCVVSITEGYSPGETAIETSAPIPEGQDPEWNVTVVSEPFDVVCARLSDALKRAHGGEV